MTSIVNNVPMTADSISTILYTYDNSWAFVSFPYDVKVKDIKPVLEGITNFAIREYSGENRAMGDMNYTWVKLNSESTLSAYKGYIISTERRMDYNFYGNELMDELKYEIKIVSTGVEKGGIEFLESLNVEDDKRITWINQDGTVKFDTDVTADKMANHINRQEIQQAMEKGTGEAIRNSFGTSHSQCLCSQDIAGFPG